MTLSPSHSRRLLDWLGRQLPGLDTADARLTPLPGGVSNDNLQLDIDGRHWLLRKAPETSAHQAAHNVLREFHILSVLADTPVHVPQPIIACDDRSVIGTPFYLMDRVNGLALEEPLPAGYRLDEHNWRHIGEALIDNLILLQQQDWQALQLDSLGHSEGFLGKQVERWWNQYRAQRAPRDQLLPPQRVAALTQWLQDHRPPAGATVIVHGDYQLGNLLFSPQPPARTLAIVDWELATLGDPLLDLATALVDWQLRAAPAPTAAELARYYWRQSGQPERPLDYYQVLSAWKRAILLHNRLCHRQPQNAEALEDTIRALLQSAESCAGGAA